MTRYMLAVHNCEGEARPAMSPEEMQQSWHEIATLEADMKSKGAWVFSGRLHDADTATVVRASTNWGAPHHRRPIRRGREHLGRLYIINAKPVLCGNLTLIRLHRSLPALVRRTPSSA